jgi:hypothetical protein
MASPGSLRRPIAERALAWLYTGPIGHLWSAVADLTGLWSRWIAGEARRRATRSRS